MGRSLPREAHERCVAWCAARQGSGFQVSIFIFLKKRFFFLKKKTFILFFCGFIIFLYTNKKNKIKLN